MKSVNQMNELIDILLDFDTENNQNKDTLNAIVNQMINNQEIYGEVKDIVFDLQYKLENNISINYGLIAADLCSYLPI